MAQYLAEDLLKRRHAVGQAAAQALGQVLCTQPRKLSATTLAERVQEEWAGKAGAAPEKGRGKGGPRAEVGCCAGGVRAPGSLITYATDQLVVTEALRDQQLSKYDVVVVDEVHERTVETDILLGLLCRAVERRLTSDRPLKAVVMSATLDVKSFVDFFGQWSPGLVADWHHVPGRTFPIQKVYAPSEGLEADDYEKAAVELVRRIAGEAPPGDVLVFLTGQDEIDRCVDSMQGDGDLLVIPLHGKAERARRIVLSFYNVEITIRSNYLASSLDFHRWLISTFDQSDAPNLQALLSFSVSKVEEEDRRKAFLPAPPGKRKAIFATNAAETGVTIDGVCYVVDCGFQKEMIFEGGVSSLRVARISASSAEQRAGRAGRTQPGTCYRLYSEEDFEQFPPMQTAEILRADPARALLRLRAMGITDVENFPLMARPSQEDMDAARQSLELMGAVDDQGQVTQVGHRMAQMELAPHLAGMLLSAHAQGCLDSMVSVVAVTSVADGLFWRGKEAQDRQRAEMQYVGLASAATSGDAFTLLRVYNEFLGAERRAEWCVQHCVRKAKLQAATQAKRDIDRMIGHIGQGELRGPDRVDPSSAEGTEALQRSICSGLLLKLAVPRGKRLQDDFVDVRSGARVTLSRRSCLWMDNVPLPDMVAYMSMVEVGGRHLIENVTPVSFDILAKLLGGGHPRLKEVRAHAERAKAGVEGTTERLSSAILRKIIGKHGAGIDALQREVVGDGRHTSVCENAHSFCPSLCLTTQQQKLLSGP